MRATDDRTRPGQPRTDRSGGRPARLARRWPLLALVLGLGALLGGVLWWLATPTLTDFGTGHPQPPTVSLGAGPSDPAAAPGRAPSTAGAPVPQGDRSLPGEPVRLTIPGQLVQAAVIPIESRNGVLEVPDDVGQVGWWTGSALVGATAGTTVLDGHVDSAAAGPGALFRLRELRQGDRLQLETAARQVGYAVTGRRIISKTGPLPADLFTVTGPARLVLISCGGPFDRVTRSYRDNIVIIAAPVR